MPDKHLFVNSSHYQDRPDPNMRHRIASHAAKYGPNGSLAFKTSPERTDEAVERSSPKSTNKSSPASSHSSSSTPRLRPASLAPGSPSGDVFLRQDYENLSARLLDFCICGDSATGNLSKAKGKVTHAEECTFLEDYVTLTREHELPFRVSTHVQQSVSDPSSAPAAEGLVLQCLLVAGQAAIDGMDPKFKNKPSKQTLAIQQKALSAMQRAISKQLNTIDDSIVLASAIMLSVAVSLHPARGTRAC